MVSNNTENQNNENESLKRVIDLTDDSEQIKKPRNNEDTETEEEETVQEFNINDEFNQLEIYYNEALENLEIDSEKASDLIKIVINESDKLLREHYEIEKPLFDFKFYLIFGSALFFHGQLNLKDNDEEKQCLALSIDRLETSHELAIKDNLNDATFFEIKLALARAYCQKSCKDMQSADIESEDHLWSQASSWLNKGASLIDETLVYSFENKTLKKGLFVVIEEEALSLIEFFQLLADRQCTWSLCKLWNNWAKENFKKLGENLEQKTELSLRAYLGIGSCLISLTNFYFDNIPQEEDSDEEEEEADESLALLRSDMSSEIAKTYLLEAISTIGTAIEGILNFESLNKELLARCYVLLGEAHLNIGNLFNDSEDSQEIFHYKKAVEAFQTSKTYHPEDLLPEAFQSFLEEWNLQLES